MNYGTLKTSVAAYLHRTDLTTVIPDFIDQARVRIGAELRSLANYTTGTVTSFSAGLSALPTNLGKLVSVTGSSGMALLMVPSEQVDRYSSGVYAVRGNDLYVPDAGAATVVTLGYFSIPAALSGSTDVSVPMVQYPQLWIYASLVEAALYLQDAELAGTMESAYQNILQAANRAGDEARFGAAPSIMADQPMIQGMASL